MILDGELTLVECFDGELEQNLILDGEPMEFMPITSVPTYEGAYEFTPSNEEQTIEIEGLKASENIIINPIPQNYGRLIWDGSRLRVY